MNLFLCGRKCFRAMSQKRALLHVISFAGNYRLFAHIDVSYRFNRESDNVVLEFAKKPSDPVINTVTRRRSGRHCIALRTVSYQFV